LLLICIVWGSVLYGDSEVSWVNRVNFEHIGSSQGFPSNTVERILQDQYGFLWIATDEGLVCYTGDDFHIIGGGPEGFSALIGKKIEVIHEDPSGALWVGTKDGLNRFDREANAFTPFPQFSGWRISALHVDRKSNLWIGTDGDGLYRCNLKVEILQQYKNDVNRQGSLSADHVRAIHEDTGGNLWVAVEGGALNRWDRDSGVFTQFTLSGLDPEAATSFFVADLAFGAGGALWLATSAGLYELEPRSGVFTRYPADAKFVRMSTVCVDASGRIWIGTTSGDLYVLDPLEGSLRRIGGALESALGEKTITSIYKDRSGILWVGSDGSALIKINPFSQPFRHWSVAAGLKSEVGRVPVTAMTEDQFGSLWFGTYGRGLFRFDPRDESTIHYKPLAEAIADRPHYISAIGEDIDGSLWAGTNRYGLYRLERGSSKFVHYPVGDATGSATVRVRSLYVDRSGTLWVGLNVGLYRFDRDARRFDRFNALDALSMPLEEGSILDIYESLSGALWLGTESGLIRVGRKDGSLHLYQPEAGNKDSLSDRRVNVIWEDSSGVLWIGTSNGLNRFDPATGQFRSHVSEDGLPIGTVNGVLPDSAGNLWISTASGISRFNPKIGTFREYNRANGLENEYYDRGSSLLSASGKMYFGGNFGVDYFRPEAVVINRHKPQMVITDFEIFGSSALRGTPIPESTEIAVQHRENFISFKFAALDFVTPGRNRYAYKLEGFDPEWIDAGPRKYANYTNLDPGDYVFRVKGSNNDGIWNENGTFLRLAVTPPFWMTLWFRFAVFVFITFLILSIHQLVTRSVRARNRKLSEINEALNKNITARVSVEKERRQLIESLKDKNRELEQFTYTVSHDLKSPLSNIRGVLEFVQEDVDAGKLELVGENIGAIDDTARRMERLLDDLLDLSRAGFAIREREEVSLNELFRDTLSMVAGSIEALHVSVAVAPDLPRVFVDPLRFPQVLQNLVGNAVKFMGEQTHPEIAIGSLGKSGEEVIFIRDNGVGIEKDAKDRIFELFETSGRGTGGAGIGLAIVKRIVELHGGRVWVESEGRGHGSTFYFTVPSGTPVTPTPVRESKAGNT
jgi:ligand-binding sensor domain-containing protein/signal transduction histidine kinase